MKINKKITSVVCTLLLCALFCCLLSGCGQKRDYESIPETTAEESAVGEINSETAESETAEWAKTLMGSIEILETAIETREEELKDEYPTVNRKNLDKYLRSFKRCLKQLKKEGVVKEYRFNDYNIAIEFTCGGTYIYEPRINNCDLK